MKHKVHASKRVKRIVVAIVAEALTLLLSSCGNSERQTQIQYISEKYNVPEEKQLIVYTSHKEEVYLPIIREFENRTGIWVEIHAGGTAEMFSEVRNGLDEGKCDIMFGGGIESYEAQKDLFMPYETGDKAILDGNYLDEDNNEPNLFITRRDDGKYDVRIGIFRLTNLDDLAKDPAILVSSVNMLQVSSLTL